MTFSTSDIKTPQPTRADFAQAFGNNQRLIRFFEQLTNDVRTTIPDALVSVTDITGAPFIVQAASSLTPNAYVLGVGNGLVQTVAPGSFGVALAVPVSIANGGTNATTASAALTNLGGVTAAQAAAVAPVQSVFGRIGTVTAQSGDYSVGQVTGAAPLASPVFSGIPTVPTAALHTNTTQAASTAYVRGEITSLVTGVSSFNSRVGAVVPAIGDYTVAQVTGAAALAGANFTGGVSVNGAFSQTGGGAVTFSVRPTWAGGAIPYDSGNLNPATFALLTGAAFTGGVSVAGAFTQTGGGAVTFSIRPTWAGATPWDSGNFTPGNYALLTGAAFTGGVSVAGSFTQTGGGPVTLSIRPTWAGATPWDTGNLNPGIYAPLAGSTFTGTVTAPLFETATASTVATTGVSTTVFTFPNAAPACWIISANIGTQNNVTNYGVVAIIYTDGTAARVAQSNVGTLMAVTVSGLNLQITQSTGVNQTIKTSLTRVG